MRFVNVEGVMKECRDVVLHTELSKTSYFLGSFMSLALLYYANGYIVWHNFVVNVLERIGYRATIHPFQYM